MGHPRANPEGSDCGTVRFENACPIDSTRRNRIPLIANLWRPRVELHGERKENRVKENYSSRTS